jgi:hypothetical protein
MAASSDEKIGAIPFIAGFLASQMEFIAEGHDCADRMEKMNFAFRKFGRIIHHDF